MPTVKKALCAWLLLTAAIAPALPLSPTMVNPNNHHTYLLLDKATWKDSEAEAVALGGHLVTIRNQAEQDWIFTPLAGTAVNNIFCGLA
jgi:hypothetical protein